MSDLAKRRFPLWLTLSVLGNLILLGLVAGILLKPNPPKGPGPGAGPGRPGIELSQTDRDTVRALLRESLRSSRAEIQAGRKAEQRFVEVLTAEPYDDAAVRQALSELREADRLARDTVANNMLEGLGELSAEQRALVAKLMSNNLDQRSKRHERFEKFRERREERLRDRAPPE